MIKTFLKSLEDPNRPLLGPNYWIMCKIGVVMPKRKLGKAIAVLVHEVAAYFILTQFMELYYIKSDIDEVLTNLKISMLSTVCIAKSHTAMLWQDSWIRVIDYVTKADKYERDTRDNETGKILDTYTKYCRRITYFYWVLIFTTFITVTHTPLIKYVSSANYRMDLKNGTVLMTHIFSAWMPINKYEYPGSWITIVWHAYICAYGASIVASYDTTAIVIMVFIGGKLDLLKERCRKMFGKDGSGISGEEAKNIMREMHQAHLLLTEHMRLFNSLLSPVMFLYVVMCSLMLCASAFQLTSATDITQKILMAEYLIFGIAELFIYCWHSHDVLVKSENLLFGPYQSIWWGANVSQRKSVLLLAGQFRIKYMFKAGPFNDLTLTTFITILKGAYSYYTLLRK